MGRTPNLTPSYLRHRSTGKARVVVRDQNGARREILLPGAYGSRESRAEYKRICDVLESNNNRLPTTKTGSIDLTVTELVLRYMDEHASTYYVDPVSNEPTGELECLALAFKPLRRLYGDLTAADFKALHLESLQRALASGSWQNDKERAAKEELQKPLGLARTTVNARIERIRRLFRWACAKELYPPENLTRLEAVATLKQHRSTAREPERVVPVDVGTVESTLPFLPPVPADMVRLLLLTGARVGELCRMRGRGLDRAGPVWLFNVPRHKTEHRGHTRTVALGPKAQLILRRYLKVDPDAYLFSPAEADRLRKAEMRERRKTPVQPSQTDRSKKNPKRKPGEQYDVRAINHAIRRACVKANVPLWHTHQLRHTAALLVMREHGIEAARSVLGHKTLNMTLFYSGVDVERAKEVAGKIG